jgi:hypothetical protein
VASRVGPLDTASLKEYLPFAMVASDGVVDQCLCSKTNVALQIDAGGRAYYAAVVAAPARRELPNMRPGS